jgi:uncharacterized repeat protein (TIGR04138 family)
MSQETAFRDVVDELRSRGSRFAREAYVFVVAALGETVRQLPADRLAHPERRHLSGRELTHGVLRIAREEFGPLAPMVFHEWGVSTTEDIGAIVFELVGAGQLSARPEDVPEDFVTGIDLPAALAAPPEAKAPRFRDA